jgi:hypothetical protein
MSWHAGCSYPEWTCLSCAAQSVCDRRAYTLTPRRDSAVRGRHSSLSHVTQSIASCYMSGCLPGKLERWLGDCKIAIKISKSTALLYVKAARRIQKPRAVQFLGEPMQWVEETQYLGLTLDAEFTWSAHVNHVWKKAAQRLVVVVPLHKKRTGLPVRNRVLLCKQLIRLMMHNACPIWRSAAHTHVWKLQVLQSMCLRIAIKESSYISNRQIHEDLGIPFFADHIRALTEGFDSKLADAGNSLFRQIVRHLFWPRADWVTHV